MAGLAPESLAGSIGSSMKKQPVHTGFQRRPSSY